MFIFNLAFSVAHASSCSIEKNEVRVSGMSIDSSDYTHKVLVEESDKGKGLGVACKINYHSASGMSAPECVAYTIKNGERRQFLAAAGLQLLNFVIFDELSWKYTSSESSAADIYTLYCI